MFNADNFTTDSIDGLLRLTHLCRVDDFPSSKVVVYPSARLDHQQKVLLISGGGDGHAPDSTGFIGKGMLTAAVSGNLFASPSTEAVTMAINTVTDISSNSSPPSVLLLIKNYTGDRLNFGLALELAASSGLDVSMCVVGDDVSIPRGVSIAGRRGIAGTILVIKLAGAAAAAGLPLTQVSEIAQTAADSLVSLGAVYSSSHFPGQSRSKQDKHMMIAEDEVALGWGIHNEEARSRIKPDSIHSLIQRMIDLLLSKEHDRDFFWKEAAAGQRDDVPTTSTTTSATEPPTPTRTTISVILMINNLGTMIDNEMHIITGIVLDVLENLGYIEVLRVLCGTFMTGLDQRGFSLSIMRLPKSEEQREQWTEWLDQQTDAPAWRHTPQVKPHKPTLLPVLQSQHSHLPATASTSAATSPASSSPTFTLTLLRNVSQTLLDAVNELNDLDSGAGDGDCGNTFKQAAESLLRDVQSRNTSMRVTPLTALFTTLRHYAAKMGGTTGAIYSILFTVAAKHCQQEQNQQEHGNGSDEDGARGTAKLAASALVEGVSVVQKYSGAQEGDRTLLDALCPALVAFLSALDYGEDVLGALRLALSSAEEGLQATSKMRARAGRASYAPASAHHQRVDPGARAIVIMLETIMQTVEQQQR